jgi:VWFA-related protein
MTIRVGSVGLLMLLTQQATEPQRPTFRGAANLVAVDVRVLDREGKPITGLAQSDFTVLEDGRPQAIRHFSAETLTARPPEAVARPTARAGTVNEPLVPPTHRTFLIVLGRGRLQYPAKGVDGALHLVRDRLLPQDQVAVMAWNRATDFTTDHAALMQVLERFKKKHEGIEAKLRQIQSGLAAVYGERGMPKAVQADIDAVFHGEGAPGVRELPASPVAEANRIAEEQRRSADNAMHKELQENRTTPDMDPFATLAAETMGLSFDEFVETSAQTNQDLGNLYTGVEYLRHIEGEKHLIFISENGMLLPRADDDRSLAARANGARVAIDTIFTGGVDPGPALAAMPAPVAGRGAPPPAGSSRKTATPTR